MNITVWGDEQNEPKCKMISSNGLYANINQREIYENGKYNETKDFKVRLISGYIDKHALRLFA